MKEIKQQLEVLRKKERRVYHPLAHKIHKKHKISKKTLFYIKEYGPHTNIARTIINESFGILILASIISSLGGVLLEEVKTTFVAFLPFLLLLPALNDMIGDYSTIIASRFSTMLHEGIIKKQWWKSQELKKLFIQILIIASVMGVLSIAGALAIARIKLFAVTSEMLVKVMTVILLDILMLISILFFITIAAGLYFYRKQEDPNNFLIPIATSIADFGNMAILALLVAIVF